MDVRQLEMFRTVAEDGTFTRAAERLRVSQSAISRQVKLLEEELGGVLLYRGPRRVSMTPAVELRPTACTATCRTWCLRSPTPTPSGGAP